MNRELFSKALMTSLRQWLAARRWFAGKARAIVRAEMVDLIPLRMPHVAPAAAIAAERGSEPPAELIDTSLLGVMILRVDYTVGEPDLYLVPFSFLGGAAAERLATANPAAIIHRFDRAGSRAAFLMADGLADPEFLGLLLNFIGENQSFSGRRELPSLLGGLAKQAGTLAAWHAPELTEILAAGDSRLSPSPTNADQSNSGIVYGDQLILKLYRRLAVGTNPELEVGRFLTETAGYTHVPELLGAIEYRPASGEPLTIGVLHRLVPGARTAWEFALDRLSGFFARLAALPAHEWPATTGAFQSADSGEATRPHAAATHSLWNLASAEPTAASRTLAGGDLDAAALLGRRTAELHVALASAGDLPDFAPEPFTEKYQQSLRWSMRDLTSRTCELLRQRLGQLPERAQETARSVLDREPQLLARFDAVVAETIPAQRIRCHGDYHLGQVLRTAQDFFIIDFEGEPARPLEERRAKKSPLVDVAGMLRSFHYAASQSLFQQLAENRRGLSPFAESAQQIGTVPLSDDSLREAADCWHLWITASFLRAYAAEANKASFLPRSATHCDRLLNVFVLEKAVYELAYELNNRPDWVEVPLGGLAWLLATG